MRVKKYMGLQLWAIVIVLIWSAGLVAACRSTQTGASTLPEVQTQLLVRAPDGPLPLNKSIEVRSRTDAAAGVSHVELYAVELPSGDKDVLIRSDPAPFSQTTFTASQQFTPIVPGHYVIKVVGYNQQGQNSTSNFISFDVR
jgi:hypothetical protein